MAYSLGSATSPNTTWGTYYNDFGVIQREYGSIDSSISTFPLFGQDSSFTDAFDFGGVIFVINLEVIKVGTTAELKAFFDALMTLQSGDQSPEGYPIDFVSDLSATTRKVKIMHIDYDSIAGRPGELSYTIKLVESSEVG